MVSNSEYSKEYYVKKLEKYEKLDIETCEVIKENITKITFGMGIILCSVPIAFASEIDDINNISAGVTLITSGIMFMSGSFITIKDFLDIIMSIIKKVNCKNEINKLKTKLSILYNRNIQLESNNETNGKLKLKKLDKWFIYYLED